MKIIRTNGLHVATLVGKYGAEESRQSSPGP